jgi:hypothetical protein
VVSSTLQPAPLLGPIYRQAANVVSSTLQPAPLLGPIYRQAANAASSTLQPAPLFEVRITSHFSPASEKGGPPPSGPPLTSAGAPIPSALLQFRVAFRNGKIGFFDQDRVQKFTFDRLVFPDMGDDSVDRHRHLFEREFDRAV